MVFQAVPGPEKRDNIICVCSRFNLSRIGITGFNQYGYLFSKTDGFPGEKVLEGRGVVSDPNIEISFLY